jgi:hypothetical protein
MSASEYSVRAAHVALEARGLQFTHAPQMIHRHADGQEEWMAVFNDTEERPLAIMSKAGRRTHVGQKQSVTTDRFRDGWRGRILAASSVGPT